MSDSIIVRVTLDSYDVVHPSEQQTQVYVQIPEVARASWLLDADFYAALKSEPWPHVIDSAHEEYQRRGVVSDSTSAAARKAVVDWLLLSEGADYDARYDAVHAAWEADQARQHPVARKLLKENEQLRAELAAQGALPMPMGPEPLALTEAQIEALAAAGNRVVNDARHEDLCMCDAWPKACLSSGNFHMGDWDMSGLESALPAVLALWEQMRGGELATLRARVTELEAERHTTNEALDDAVQELRARRDEDSAKCRCDEPGADPYACEADDCSGEFSELNPFGGGPVEGHDAKVSRSCGCGFRTTVWHVADGSAEEELHRHVTRVHGGIYPETGGERP